MSKESVFSNYARYYDLLYRDKDYAAETRFVLEQLALGERKTKSVLELGCGTGIHAICMAKNGLVVDGIDLSIEMLREADIRKKAESAEVSNCVSFMHGDARSVRTGKTYDSVVSLFHVMSYQNSNRDLKDAIETAAIHLESGGLFLFDYWYGPAVLSQLPEVRVRRLEDDSILVTRIAEPKQRLQDNIIDVNYSVMIQDKENHKTETVLETHSMRYLFLPEIEYLAGELFSVVKSGEWLSAGTLSSNSWAGYSLLVRR